jgi:hypothetical protein
VQWRVKLTTLTKNGVRKSKHQRQKLTANTPTAITMYQPSNSNSTATTPCRSTVSDTHFPIKLHDMLAHVEREGLQSVISWVENGRAFMIHDPDKLVDVLKLFFGQTKYRSFRRQLNHWHFERVLHGPNRGAFEHPFFVRGRKTLCRQRSRNSFESAAPKRLRMGSQAIIDDHKINASMNQLRQNASFITPSSSTSCSPLLTGMEQERNKTTCDTVESMNKQFLSTMIQMNDEITATIAMIANNKGCLEDGDIVPFEGRRFHFLDLGSLDLTW